MRAIIIFALLFGVAGAGEKSLQELYPAGVYPTGPSLGPREPRLLFFTADWCQPCHIALDRETLPGSHPPQPGGFRKWLKNWTIDESNRAHIQLVDHDGNPDLVAKYKVTQLPSVVVIDGQHHDAVPYVNMQAMVKLLEKPRARMAAFAADDIRRLGCKISPNLGSGVNTWNGVLTCWHCVNVAVAKGQPIQVECDGEIATGTVIAWSERDDLALLRVNLQRASIDSKHVGPYSDGKPIPVVGDTLRSIARLRDGTIGVETHKVLGYSFDGMILVDNPFISGSSGGGVIDSRGFLVGVVNGNQVGDEPFQGRITPPAAINRLLQRP